MCLQQLNIPIIDINRIAVTEEVLQLRPEAVARKCEVVPIDDITMEIKWRF
jgi:type IV pilus assembly protein PilB